MTDSRALRVSFKPVIDHLLNVIDCSLMINRWNWVIWCQTHIGSASHIFSWEMFTVFHPFCSLNADRNSSIKNQRVKITSGSASRLRTAGQSRSECQTVGCGRKQLTASSPNLTSGGGGGVEPSDSCLTDGWILSRAKTGDFGWH